MQKKYSAKSEMIQIESPSHPGSLMDQEVQYFEINGNKYSISVDALAHPNEPTVYITVDGKKVAVESEYTGFEAMGLCFDTAEIGSEETGLPALPGYIHSTFEQFVVLEA